MNNTLWAFGCSETFGLFLPDAIPTKFSEWGSTNTLPSSLAWPALVANRLGFKCKNLSKSGNSNKGIVLDILTHKEQFLPDDIICIQWTFGIRGNVYLNPHTNVNLNTFAEDGKGKKMVYSGQKKVIMKAYENFLLSIDYNTTSSVDKFIYIDYINNIIKKNKVFNFSVYEGLVYDPVSGSVLSTTKPFWKMDTTILSSNWIGREHRSRAADGHHTGVKGHKKLSKHYYKIIKDRL
tara:strand:- start:1274 stop:1981 length:708 start_codon:yes stop_codon:yes gene_type:complete